MQVDVLGGGGGNSSNRWSVISVKQRLTYVSRCLRGGLFKQMVSHLCKTTADVCKVGVGGGGGGLQTGDQSSL